ncbi:MAG: sugar phosphate isomerase/epimerase family protein [Thermodesulfobacteriota bacterium]
MKLGFCTMGYVPYTELDEAIHRIANMGYEVIDFWAYSPHLDPRHYDKEGRKHIRQLVEKVGLEIAGLSVQGGGLGMQFNFSHSNPKVRKDTVEYYLDCVDLAADVGSPVVNLISGHMVYGTTLEQAWAWNRECIQQVVERAEKKNIVIAIHTLTPPESEVIVTLDDALRMMKEVGSEKLKVMIDTADQNVTEPNLTDAVRKVGKDLVYVHLNDNCGEGRGDIHLPPGRGNINWKKFVKTLKEIGYNGNMTVQVNTGYPIDIDAWAEESLEYMRKVLQEVGWS